MPTKCQQNAQFVYFLHSTYIIQYQYIANYSGGTIHFTVHTSSSISSPFTTDKACALAVNLLSDSDA